MNSRASHEPVPESAAGAGDVAQTLAMLVPAASVKTLCQLRELLAHTVAAPTAAQLREVRLGLLIEMVSTGTGEVPGVAEYEALRARRADQGEIWASSTQLQEAYGGHWLKAVKAAMRMHFNIGHGRVPRSYAHCHDTESYTRTEIAIAIEQCKVTLTDWPTEWEYLEWRRVCRMGTGYLSPKNSRRLPCLKQICVRYGDFDRAMDVTRRWVDGEIDDPETFEI